jgi:hypothetical protein
MATVSISALSMGMRNRCHASGCIVIDVASSAKHTQSCTKAMPKSSNTDVGGWTYVEKDLRREREEHDGELTCCDPGLRV